MKKQKAGERNKSFRMMKFKRRRFIFVDSKTKCNVMESK